MITYGQIKEGKRISFTEFQAEVTKGASLAGCVGISIITINKLYKAGKTVSDAISYLIIHS